MTFSIVVPTYRRPDALSLTLDALLRMEWPADEFEIIVVDDGSDVVTEQTVAERSRGPVRVTYIGQPNSGPARARNHGAELAEGDVLVFCDDDIIVEPDHLTLQAETRGRYPDSLVNGVITFSSQAVEAFARTSFGRYRLELDRRWLAEADGAPLEDGYFTGKLLTAANLAIPRSLFRELGGFDEAFPYPGAEDQALSLAAREAGLELIRNHAIRILHNDQTLSFRQFCAREEKSAHTVVVLARLFPDEAERPLYRMNARISRSDSPAVILKKLGKAALAGQWSLAAIHCLVDAVERVRLRQAWMERIYSAVVGLHIFRGVRKAR
jgi:glycosyltransferase involved in cell wall biosynthesis